MLSPSAQTILIHRIVFQPRALSRIFADLNACMIRFTNGRAMAFRKSRQDVGNPSSEIDCLCESLSCPLDIQRRNGRVKRILAQVNIETPKFCPESRGVLEGKAPG